MATKKKVNKKNSASKKSISKKNVKTKKVDKKVNAKPLPTSHSIKTKEVNWTMTLVLSIFLGMLGVDRFVMGKFGTGILKLLITVLSFGILGWIWWIIDVILIAKKYQFEGIKWVD